MSFKSLVKSILNIPQSNDTELSKEDIAQILKTSPQALAEFEKAYSLVEDSVESHNPMLANSHIATALAENDATALSQELYDMTQAIADELVFISNNDQKALTSGNYESHVVSPAEVAQFPQEIAPQLTSTHAPIDIDESSSTLLYHYSRFLKSGQSHSYHMFRQGLDIVDLDPITYEMLSMNDNAMSHWLPALEQASTSTGFFKIPKTKIVKVPMTLLQLTRTIDYSALNSATIAILNEWCMRAFELDENKTYFIKTGTYSSKFDFRNAKVTSAGEVREIGQYLFYLQQQAVHAASPLTTPSMYGISTTNEWVVREYIEDVEDNPTIYHGMPLRTEFRFFIDADSQEVLGVSPYWREDIMNERFNHRDDVNEPNQLHDGAIFAMHKDKLAEEFAEHVDELTTQVQTLLPELKLSGQWSLDIMKNGEDFYLIDMATADTSALNDVVPAGKLKKSIENWLPAIEK